MKSPWGSRGELCKTFGWTYDYLLWGISWINVNMMTVDAARLDTTGTETLNGEPVTRVELRSKDDIKKFINGE